jgi:hypothetical protein
VLFSTVSNAATNAGADSMFKLGGDLSVNRLGFGAMRITGEGIWGWPKDREEARKVLKRAAKNHGASVYQLAIAWLLARSPVNPSRTTLDRLKRSSLERMEVLTKSFRAFGSRPKRTPRSARWLVFANRWEMIARKGLPS